MHSFNRKPPSKWEGFMTLKSRTQANTVHLQMFAFVFYAQPFVVCFNKQNLNIEKVGTTYKIKVQALC